LTRTVFLVNGPENGPIAERARAFASRLGDRFEIAVAYRSAGRMHAVKDFLALLRRERPQICYVLDMSYSGVVAGIVAKVLWRIRLVIDTGDAVYELARSAGLRGPVGLALTWLLERLALRLADRIVVRGTFHRKLLAGRGVQATTIPDGIDTTVFSSAAAPADLKARLGLHDVLSVGFLGSLVWSERLQIGYGWDLVEAMRILGDEPVKGVLIGGGSARPILEARAREYGLGDRMLFLDPIPYDDVPQYLAAIDVWLSTQTNDIPGNVRTTGKLPLYLAAGRYVLASDVGEASLVLPREMLVEYHGTVDRDYPARLAERIREIVRDRGRLSAGAGNVEIARTIFDYDVLAERVADVLESVSPGGRATS
jgi:glycosyltransferase involved in cell wall biosynthesis